MILSVVVPMFNEADALPHFAARLRPVLDQMAVSYEVVCVDDGSADDTVAGLRALAQTWPNLRVLVLRRNAGHQAALTAGMERALGDYIVTIDADLQDPPEVIPQMLQAARETGSEVVYGVRADRTTDTAFKRLTAGWYYRIMRRTVGAPVARHAGDFRMMSASAVAEIAALPERGRVYRLLIPYMGFRSTEVEYRREARVAGQSKYPLRKMAALATDSYFSFTTAPLRLATWVGLAGFLLCSGFALVALYGWSTGNTVPGWASSALAIGFIGAIQFVFLGLIGEYLARVYTELQSRPRYFVAEYGIGATPGDVIELGLARQSIPSDSATPR